ncbi:MAG TPA: S49 family peptidase, partial [Phycisphaerales bacterium]|nr:S49 family peptidase [Phycisphaerales bacterium]
AASGGYYISCGANKIFAEQTTITGSIGVIAHVMTFKGLMDKVGVEPETIVASSSPAKAVANDMYRNWNEADRKEVQMLLDSAYEVFISRVKAGRGAIIGNDSQVAAIADGSVYTPMEAQKAGLIDGIGYLDDAIAAAEKLAGFGAGSCEVDMLRRPGSLMGALLAEQQGLNLTNVTTGSLRHAMNEMSTTRPMYLMH